MSTALHFVTPLRRLFMCLLLFLSVLLVSCGGSTRAEVHEPEAEAHTPFICFQPHGGRGLLEPVYAMTLAHAQEKDAETVFLGLTNSPEVSDAVYGLVGLKIIDSKFYARKKQQLSARFGNGLRLNYSTGGCTGTRNSALGEVLAIVEAQRFDAHGMQFGK